jgi:hypothetical protein
MSTKKRQQIRIVLHRLSEWRTAALKQLQQAFVLLDEESALDPPSVWKAHTSPHAARRPGSWTSIRFALSLRLAIPAVFSATPWGFACLICGVVKTHGRKVCDADLAELACAIHGSEWKRFALRLD